MVFPEQLIHVDSLSLIMMGLVGFVALAITSFSSRYLKGDRKQGAFYLNLGILVPVVFVMVSADHLLLLMAAWVLSNLLLTRLMLHKSEWLAARNAAQLALKNFGLGFLFLGSAFYLLYAATGETSIQAIITSPLESSTALAAGLLVLLAAMTQSSLWPFHRWLTSSLNSPTPVSALMHAGLVNGGGFLLVRFAPMLAEQPVVLGIIFAAGITAAILGTLWKLMQSDIKRMLACSTMGQMGFMVAQCGLGLFPAAVAHLCWHGLFKAYLFLSAGSAAKDKRLDSNYPPSFRNFITALFCALPATYLFAVISGKNLVQADTSLFLVLIALIAAVQFALPVLQSAGSFRVPFAFMASALAGVLYGFSIFIVELALAPMGINMAQPLNMLHIAALVALTAAWLYILLGRSPKEAGYTYPDWMLSLYVRALNAGQPHPKTVTAVRNHYKF